MNNFPVTINIRDVVCDKCSKQVFEKDTIVNDSSQTINLQNDYTLNVLTVDVDFCTILLQNGLFVVIRRVFTTFPIQVNLPAKCEQHIMTISVSIP